MLAAAGSVCFISNTELSGVLSYGISATLGRCHGCICGERGKGRGWGEERGWGGEREARYLKRCSFPGSKFTTIFIRLRLRCGNFVIFWSLCQKFLLFNWASSIVVIDRVRGSIRLRETKVIDTVVFITATFARGWRHLCSVQP